MKKLDEQTLKAFHIACDNLGISMTDEEIQRAYNDESDDTVEILYNCEGVSYACVTHGEALASVNIATLELDEPEDE